MAINKTDVRKAHFKRWRKEDEVEVKGFSNKELNEAFITTPKIVCDYISALQRVLDMSEETNKKAIAKIRKLDKAIDDISNSERKTIVDLNEANKRLKKQIDAEHTLIVGGE